VNIKLIAALIVAITLVLSHWKAYTTGKANERTAWNVRTIKANDDARELERLNRQSKEIALENQKRDLTANTIAARRAADAANSLLNTSERSLQTSRENHAACIVSAATHAELLGRCEREYRDMAGKAQGHATDVKALVESWPK
jgi:hypothetical protein